MSQTTKSKAVVPPADQGKNLRLVWVLLALSLFMFVSFIVKTAIRGP